MAQLSTSLMILTESFGELAEMLDFAFSEQGQPWLDTFILPELSMGLREPALGDPARVDEASLRYVMSKDLEELRKNSASGKEANKRLMRKLVSLAGCPFRAQGCPILTIDELGFSIG